MLICGYDCICLQYWVLRLHMLYILLLLQRYTCIRVLIKISSTVGMQGVYLVETPDMSRAESQDVCSVRHVLC